MKKFFGNVFDSPEVDDDAIKKKKVPQQEQPKPKEEKVENVQISLATINEEKLKTLIRKIVDDKRFSTYVSTDKPIYK